MHGVLRHCQCCAAVVVLCACAAASFAQQPNIVVIMCDDLGYADIGPYGGEIDTPNLDTLAEHGRRYTRFYTTGRCTPSRGALLTGQYAHRVGVGHLTFQENLPGYQGQLDSTAPTIAEVLRSAGYSTFMVGKWHLTRTSTIGGGPNGSWPHQRGFDTWYGTMENPRSYFSPTWLFDAGACPPQVAGVTAFPADYFLAADLADAAADRIARADPLQPLFLYVAFCAPHFPLQAPADLVSKYRSEPHNHYAAGWDPIRQMRLDEQVAQGIAPAGSVLSPTPSTIPDWSALDAAKQDEMDLRMAVYAAQVDLIDQGVGRIMQALQAADRFNNTVIFFLSDNGPTAGAWDGTGPPADIGLPSAPMDMQYGAAWANTSNVPFREWKCASHEGGIASPLIIHWPCGMPGHVQGTIDGVTQAHLIDVMPTVLELAGATYPGQPPGCLPAALEGVSLVPSITAGETVGQGRTLCWEHTGNRGVSDGAYKAVAAGPAGAWELYHIANDRNEATNLAAADPETLHGLIVQWEAWALRNQVIPWPFQPAYSPQPPLPDVRGDLLVHLRMDAAYYAEDAAVLDASGNALDGVFRTFGAGGAPTVPTGITGLGNAIDFGGALVEVPWGLRGPALSAPRSMAVWVNTDQLGDDRPILGYGAVDGADGGQMVVTMEGGAADAAVVVDFGGARMRYEPPVGAEIGVQAWVHLVCVVPEGAVLTSDVRMYLNGAPVAGTAIEEAPMPLATGASYLGVGMRGGAAPGGQDVTRFFDGRIGDVQVYRVALTAYEAAYLFENPGDSLALRFDFDDDQDVDADDLRRGAACVGGPQVFSPPADCALVDFQRADGDGDGDVDLRDLGALATACTGASGDAALP